MGDSTFFHSGQLAISNAVKLGQDITFIILDNSTTAMTGHQPHPDSVGAVHPIPIENMVLACGVKPENMKIIDQGQSEEFIAAVREFVDKPEVSVIIARRPCKFVEKKE